MNLSDFLRESARSRPDHCAIRFKDIAITYAEMDRQVDAVARGFSRLGLKKGDTSVLMMPNSINWVLVYYALARMGALVVPVNPLYRRGELKHMFIDSGARAIVGHAGYLEEPIAVINTLPTMDIRIADGGDIPSGFAPLNDLVQDSGKSASAKTKPDDPFAVIYTSGTTGLPKGAVLTHGNLMSDVQAVAGLRNSEPDDVVLCVLPLFHIYGQTHALNLSIFAGLTIRMWDAFDPVGVMAVIEDEENTQLYAVPTMINRLVEQAAVSRPKRSGLRFCISGGASLPVEILKRFEEAFNTSIVEGYGLTECSPTCIENPYGKNRPGAIGFPVPGFKARIVDDNDGDVQTGKVGELIVSGPGVMKEYLNQPEATATTLRGGWLHTGDLAKMDDDGYIYIVDRKKEMIIRGGYNVYPREIEEIIYTHPAVLEAAVLGVPHPDLGEEVAAAVVLRPGSTATPDELRQYIKERVAPYKYPRVVKILDELPKSSTGKILKREISIS